MWKNYKQLRSAVVQSVALKLICEREIEIEKFNIEEYWSIMGSFSNNKNETFNGRLIILNTNKLKKMDIRTEKEANTALDKINSYDFKISKIQKKRVKRNPLPPYTTSTLQQDASNKLGFGASRTMSIAQKLYEGINIGSQITGLITYMRTDAQLSSSSINAQRRNC